MLAAIKGSKAERGQLFKLIVPRQGYFMSLDGFTIESVTKGIVEDWKRQCVAYFVVKLGP